MDKEQPQNAALKRRSVIAWAMYDWANSAFATTVMAGFFPVFFKQYWSAGTDAATTTFRLGLANSLASLLIAVSAPFLGAVADAGLRRKRFLMVFAAFGCVATAGLFSVSQGQWLIALLLFVAGSIGFMGGNIFYDSLLVSVAEERERDRVSALGYGLGYLGGGILFAVNVGMTLKPEVFGFAGPAEAVRASFLCVALWWAVFSIPLVLFVRELRQGRPSAVSAIKGGVVQLVATFKKVRALRVVFTFLIAYWLYIDGVDTIIRMAVDFGLSIGLESKHLMTALLITQFVGFPAAILFGRLGERWGAKRAILVAIGVYIGVTVFASRMQSSTEFYALAVTVGLVQGGIQALSRSLYSLLIPAGQASEFFGFYNLLGKFAAIIGPVLVGSVGVVTGDPRSAILSVLVLFIAGGLMLYRLDVAAGIRLAREL